jgi:signal transduction histidine kinase/tetratricopeptide (TPR) repeat protein
MFNTSKRRSFRNLLLPVLLVAAPFFARTQSVDQLKQELASAGSARQRMPLLQALVDTLWERDQAAAGTYFSQLKREAEKAGAPYYLGYVSERMGGLAYVDGKLDSARIHYRQASDHYRQAGDAMREYKVLTRVGIMHSIQGNYAGAEEIYRAVLQKAAGEPEALAFTWNQMGTLYHYQGQVDSAGYYYDRSAGAYGQLRDTSGMLRPMYNHAVLLTEQGRTAKSESILLQVVTLQERIGAVNDLALSTHALSDHFRTQGELKKAMDYAKASYGYARQAGNDQRLISSLISLARISSTNRDTSTAVRYLQEGLDIARQGSNIQQLQSLMYYLSNIHLEQGAYARALETAREGLALSGGQASNRTLPYLLINEGMALRQLGQTEEARASLLRSAEMADQFLNHEAAAISRQQLAESYLQADQADRAWMVARDAWERHAPYIQAQANMELAGTLHRAGSRLQRWKEALHFHEWFKVLHDSINDTEKVRQLTLESKDFAFQLELQRLEAERQQREAVLTEKALRIRIIAIGLTLLAAMVLVFLAQSRRKNRIISEKNRQLEQLNLTKDRLFAIIGHDLRKPAIAFRGITRKVNYLLRKKDYETLNALGDQIEDNARDLNQLTDNLLYWALSQKNVLSMKKESLDLGEELRQVVSLFSEPARRKEIGLALEIPAGIKVLADRDTLHTVCRNLLDNALKFTPEGGQVSLIARRDPQGIDLEIRDTGMGIPAHRLEGLFTLQRDKSTPGTGGEKGTGLGLHLVHELVHLNGGRISVQSMEGQGSTFTVHLPHPLD